jgi:ring-1,2-phenylacetyl-CoA epoxidase subunit PaaD
VITQDIESALKKEGYTQFVVNYVHDKPWTTDWISEEGKNKLKAYGIAPPVGSANKSLLTETKQTVPCPLCDSKNTKLVSFFGSTACKSLYQCEKCLEPFDYFKCH